MLRVDPGLKNYFKNFCYSPQIIMLYLYMKFRFSLSYREIEELCQLRGLDIDHSTLQRWVERFLSLLDNKFRQRKKKVHNSWRMDETYIKLKGKWLFLYRAVDKYGATIDFLIHKKEILKPQSAFFAKQLERMENLIKLMLIKVDLIKQRDCPH